MSLFNLIIEPRRGRVLVDTLASCDPTLASRLKAAIGLPTAGSANKVFVLGQPAVVVAGRGNPAYLATVVELLCLRMVTDFDGAQRCFAEVAREAAQAFAGLLEKVGGGELTQQEVALVGWSQKKRQVAAILVCQDSVDSSEVFEFDGAPAWITPWKDEWGDEFSFESDEVALSSAREQARRINATDPGCVGGRLLLAEVTQLGVSLRELGRL